MSSSRVQLLCSMVCCVKHAAEGADGQEVLLAWLDWQQPASPALQGRGAVLLRTCDMMADCDAWFDELCCSLHGLVF